MSLAAFLGVFSLVFFDLRHELVSLDSYQQIRGQVVDIWKPETYIVSTTQGERLLRSTKKLTPGEEILVG
ncbi:MAG: hypothetical protein H6765_05415 [Candidatus Peribacteria bacterium]|nr:MAG: hypothetical protein H6765_05415 [Candidatus Peribacteria bacterium]